jgi:accessory gene regulator B
MEKGGQGMISSICRKTAESLGNELGSSNDQVEVYAYALEILLGTALKLVLIIILAIIFDILSTTLISLFTLAVFRWLGGGVHLSTYLRCLLVGLFIVLGMGYVASLEVDCLYLICLFSLSLFTAIYVIVKWVPAGTDKKKVTEIEKRFRQKWESIYALTIWSIGVIACIYGNLYSYALAAILGSLFSSFLMMPAGYRVIGSLDNILAVFSKGGKEVV